jgi:hypothetical protein
MLVPFFKGEWEIVLKEMVVVYSARTCEGREELQMTAPMVRRTVKPGISVMKAWTFISKLTRSIWSN